MKPANTYTYLVYKTSVSTENSCIFIFDRYVGPATITSERLMRKQQKELLGDYIVGETVPLQFPSDKAHAVDGYETREVPIVTVSNLSEMVIDYLNRLERYL